jgi:hypothetical protein
MFRRTGHETESPVAMYVCTKYVAMAYIASAELNPTEPTHRYLNYSNMAISSAGLSQICQNLSDLSKSDPNKSAVGR